MSVSVVAILTAHPGLGRKVIDSFRVVSPLVHAEPGCELYAANLQQNGDTVVMVERWSTIEALEAHAEGPALAKLNQLNADLLVRPYDVWIMDEVPLGDPARGVIPRAS